jgi:hypothetical protein
MVELSDKLFAIMGAASVDLHKAKLILAKLEDDGFTIYKKKVFKNGRRPSSSAYMTKALKAKIVEFYRANPTVTQSKIAAMFNVNAGRVAEALSGDE